MPNYNLFKDILDTYQSFDQVMQILWLVVPCVTLVMLVALFFRYRLERNNQEARIADGLAGTDQEAWRAELDRDMKNEFRDFVMKNNHDPRWVHPFLWEDESSGRVVAYPAPVEGAPVLLALLDYSDYPSGRKE